MRSWQLVLRCTISCVVALYSLFLRRQYGDVQHCYLIMLKILQLGYLKSSIFIYSDISFNIWPPPENGHVVTETCRGYKNIRAVKGNKLNILR
jgi:hypothetical protein